MPEIFVKPTKTTSKPQINPQPQVVMDEAKVNKMPVRQLLSAFLRKPKGIHFETQEDGEEILLFMRAHPITILGWILGVIILILLPIFILPLILGFKILPQFLPAGYYVILPLLYYLGVFGLAFAKFLQWYYNDYIVTSQRIIDIDWVSLLYKEFSSAMLNKVQDVNYRQGGLLDSFFNYGNVFIQTAGTEPNFEFENIPQPDKVVREINAILETYNS